MGARNSKKETPPHPPSSEWAKKASLYKHTGTPGKDGGQRKEKKKNKMNWADLHQEKFVDGIIAFSKLTTCHGPGHVVRNRGTCFGVMWAVITIVLYICLMVIQGDLLVRFSKREVQSQTTLGTAKISGLPLPSVIICNRGFFSNAKMKAQGVSDEVGSYIIVALLLHSLVNKEVMFTDRGYALARRAYSDLLRILKEKNMNIAQLIASISYSCEEIVLKCFYGDTVNATHCCKEFKPIPTVTGLCFSRPAQPNDRQSSAGEFGGFTVFAKLPVDDLMEFVPEIIDVTTLVKVGIQVTVTSNLSYPGYLVMGQGTILTPHELTSLRLSVTQTDRTHAKTYLDFHLPSCVRAEDVDVDHDSEAYLSTSVSCIDGAYFKCYKEICDCYNYAFTSRGEKTVICTLNQTMSYNYHLYKEFSKVFEKDFLDVGYSFNKSVSAIANTCVTRELNRCTPVCVELNYGDDSEVSALRPEMLREAYQEFQLDENTTKISVVTIFYPTMNFASIKEWRMDLLDLLSDTGSYMGLFLGCSLITLTEFSIATIRFCLWVWYRFCAWLRPSPHQPQSTTHRIKVSIRPVSPH